MRINYFRQKKLVMNLNIMKKTGIAMLLSISVIQTGCNDSAPEPAAGKPANDQIMITSIPDDVFTIPENPNNGAIISTVTGISNLGQVSLSLESQSPEGALVFNKANGELRIADRNLFDFEKHPKITCTIKGTVGEEWNDITITIHLTDEPEFKSVQQLLDEGKTPWEIYNDNTNYQDSSVIGRMFQGGMIYYYHDFSGQVWIISLNDIGEYKWGCKGTLISKSASSMWNGPEATNAIVAECAEANIAAGKCAGLTLNGYSDWYLPSESDMIEITQGDAGVYYSNKINWKAGSKYWTSTQSNSDQAIMAEITVDGYADIVPSDKDLLYLVRPVRTFIQ